MKQLSHDGGKGEIKENNESLGVQCDDQGIDEGGTEAMLGTESSQMQGEMCSYRLQGKMVFVAQGHHRDRSSTCLLCLSVMTELPEGEMLLQRIFLREDSTTHFQYSVPIEVKPEKWRIAV